MQKIQSFRNYLKTSLWFFLSVVIFLLVIAGLLYLDSRYKIQYIQLKTSSNSIQIRGISALQNKNLYLLSEKETKDSILSSNPYVKDVSIAKQYPDTLILTIKLNTPRAYLQVKDGYFLLADEAYILEKNREVAPSKVPVITYYQNIPFSTYQAGQQIISKDIQDSLIFLRKLQSMRIPINSIDIKGFHMLGLYTENQEYFFSSEKDINEQIYQLEASVSQFSVSGEKFKSLDLRFDKPVAVF